MKPTVPETGRVIRLDNDKAVIMLEGNKSCKGCGAAKIGLCRAGSVSMFLTAKNTAGAGQGDQVMIGIDRKTQWKGYLLGYLIPLLAFICGAAAGHIAAAAFAIPLLDIAFAFLFLALASVISYRRLKVLDKTNMMEVKRVVSDGVFNDFSPSEEERLYMKYLSI